MGRILRVHAHFWQDRLPQELDVIVARRKQLQSHAAASKLAAKAKKAAKLDRIAHPEKYKQLSPTVRRTGRVWIVNSPSQLMTMLTRTIPYHSISIHFYR